MRRQGGIGRDQTERLTRLTGVRGVRKSTRVFTTRPYKTTALSADLVNRRFSGPAPIRLWVCDITYVATWSGLAYVRIRHRRVLAPQRRVERRLHAVGRDPADEQLELATLEWVWWWNNSRLHGELDLHTPIKVKAAYYADLESAQPVPAAQGSR